MNCVKCYLAPSVKRGKKEIKPVMQEVRKAADAGQRGQGESGRGEGPPPT